MTLIAEFGLDEDEFFLMDYVRDTDKIHGIEIDDLEDDYEEDDIFEAGDQSDF